MKIPVTAKPITRGTGRTTPAASGRWRGGAVRPADNLCQCQYGQRMCPENKNCECVDGYPRCVD